MIATKLDDVLFVHIKAAAEYIRNLIVIEATRLALYDVQWNRESELTLRTAETLEDKLNEMRETRAALLGMLE